MVHDGLKVSGFQNDATSYQDNVATAGQKRDSISDEDPSFGREQSVRSDDMIYGEFIARVTSLGV